MPVRATQYLHVLPAFSKIIQPPFLLDCRFLGLEGISTIQSRQHNCFGSHIYPGSHVSQALWFTSADYKRKYIAILKIRAQVFLKVKYFGPTKFMKIIRRIKFIFLFAYTQLLEVWSIDYLATSAACLCYSHQVSVK